MNELDEVSRRLPGVLHAVLTLLSVPYFLLAIFFMIVGRIASQRGLWNILDTFLNAFNWTMTWGIVLLGMTLITVLAAGFFEPLRWWAALALAGMVTVTLCILLFHRSSVPSVGELIFLAPAFLILITTCWTLVWRQ